MCDTPIALVTECVYPPEGYIDRSAIPLCATIAISGTTVNRLIRIHLVLNDFMASHENSKTVLRDTTCDGYGTHQVVIFSSMVR